MKLRWSPQAVHDLVRLRDFVARVNPAAAARIMRRLREAPSRLREQPGMGRRLDLGPEREIRSILEGPYEIRYEVLGDFIYILRIWHGREDR